MYPVFGGIPDEVLLSSSCRTVALNWLSPSTYEIVELRKLDDEGIVIVLEERLSF